MKNAINEIPPDYGSKSLYGTDGFPVEKRFYYQKEKYRWSKIQFEYLKKIQEICANNDIEFTLFIPPFRSDFNSFFRDNSGVNEEFKILLKEYDIQANIFGKIDILDKNQDTLFYDELHLNAEGQKVFSKVFYELSTQEKTTYDENYSWFLKDNR